MAGTRCLIYGAYGYAGRLIVREAIRRELRPVLAGRRQEPLEEMSDELGLPCIACGLEDADNLDELLQDIDAVLHCAGPFVRTSRPMVAACIQTGTHYLDITGEIAVFESVFRADSEARKAGLVLLPGVGLDVVPSDCLADHLAHLVPGATHLELALMTDRGSASRGTLCTMIEGLPHIGAERVDGQIVARPPAFDSREIEFSIGRRWAMTIPWGDLATAYRTTGIPNIRVYMGASPRRVKRLRRLRPFLPVLGTRAVKRTLQWMIRRRVTGPGEEIRDSARAAFWGSVRNPEGTYRSALLETPEGYKLTAMTAVECLKRVLDDGVEPGAWTPAAAFGPDFIKTFPGVSASW